MQPAGLKSNVNNSTYILDNGLATPVFATYNGSVGTNGGSRYIAAGQGILGEKRWPRIAYLVTDLLRRRI